MVYRHAFGQKTPGFWHIFIYPFLKEGGVSGNPPAIVQKPSEIQAKTLQKQKSPQNSRVQKSAKSFILQSHFWRVFTTLLDNFENSIAEKGATLFLK